LGSNFCYLPFLMRWNVAVAELAQIGA
jgi:hypothetical protein